MTHANINNKTALAYMLVSVIIYSMLPFVYVFAGSKNAPFLWVSILYAATLIPSYAYLLLLKPNHTNIKPLQIIMAHWKHKTAPATNKPGATQYLTRALHITPNLIWVSVAHLDYALFAVALKYIDITLATAIASTAPIIIVITLKHLFDNQNRYNVVTSKKWALLLLAFCGCLLVLISQRENINDAIKHTLALTSLLGIAIACISTALNGLGMPCSLKWGADTARKVMPDNRPAHQHSHSEQYFTILGDTAASNSICSGIHPDWAR